MTIETFEFIPAEIKSLKKGETIFEKTSGGTYVALACLDNGFTDDVGSICRCLSYGVFHNGQILGLEKTQFVELFCAKNFAHYGPKIFRLKKSEEKH